jgi:hypothetical protein
MTLPNDEHYEFCDRPTHPGGKAACCTPTYDIPGVNVGTWAALWVTADDFHPLKPTAANLDLGRGDRPLNGGETLFLDSRGLRELAATATKVADLLDGSAA